MAFTLVEQLSSDMDLFFKLPHHDAKLHVATAGGILPEKVMELDEILNKNAQQFLQIERNFGYEINPNLDEVVSFKSTYHRELYIEDFVDKAQRGFWSFDKTNINDPYDRSFHIVAYPKHITSMKKVFPVELFETPFDSNIFQNILNSNFSIGKISLFENI